MNGVKKYITMIGSSVRRKRPTATARGSSNRRWRREIEEQEEEDCHSSDGEAKGQENNSDDLELHGDDKAVYCDEEPLAMLARWCRGALRFGGPGADACKQALCAAGAPPCPRRLLHHLGSSDAGQAFLQALATKLRSDIHSTTCHERCRRYATLGGILERLGNLTAADLALREGLAAEGISLPEMDFSTCAMQSPLADVTLRRAVGACTSAASRALVSSLIRLRRQRRADHIRSTNSRPRQYVRARPVARAPASLSVLEFERDFAATGTPVILTLPPGNSLSPNPQPPDPKP